MKVTTLALHFHPSDPITHVDHGVISIGTADANVWLDSDDPAAWEALAAHCVTAANTLRDGHQ